MKCFFSLRGIILYDKLGEPVIPFNCICTPEFKLIDARTVLQPEIPGRIFIICMADIFETCFCLVLIGVQN